MMNRRARLVLLAACSSLALVLSEEPEPSPILAPPPQSAHPAGTPVRFIASGASGAELKLDGKSVPGLQSPHEGVYTAELPALAPGVHELEFAGRQQRFAVLAGGESKPPEGFAPFRAHPPANQCQTCHAVRNGRWRFQRVSLASVCGQCHAKESFQAKHTHEMALLTDCQLCHNPHGSTTARPAHLKLAREVACKQCHAQ